MQGSISWNSPLLLEKRWKKINFSSNFGYTSSYDINYFYCDQKEISSTAKIGLLVFYPFIMFIGLVGNFLIILIVFTHEELRETTNWFIVNMAVSDFMFSSISTPVGLAEMAESSWPDNDTTGLVLCKLQGFCTSVSLYVSVQSIFWIAIDSFVAVVYPMKAHFISSRSRRISIPSTWLVAMGVNSVELSSYQVLEVQSKFICTSGLDDSFETDRIYMIYSLLYTFVFQITPFIALTVIYSVIALTLRKQDKRLHSDGKKGTRPNVRLRRQQAIKMSFFTMAAFYTCSLPLLVSAIIWEFQISVSCSFETTFWQISMVMVCLSSVANPLIWANLLNFCWTLSRVLEKHFKGTLEEAVESQQHGKQRRRRNNSSSDKKYFRRDGKFGI